jgi:hypothetical protein
VTAQSNGESFLVRDDVFEYLLDHPDFATHVIRALEIGRYRIWREPDGLWLDDTAGALVRFRIAYATRGSRIFYLQGRYQPQVLPAIHGRVVVLLDYTIKPQADGKSLITPAMASFVRIDNAAFEVLARLFSGRGAPSHEGDDAHRRRYREDRARDRRRPGPRGRRRSANGRTCRRAGSRNSVGSWRTAENARLRLFAPLRAMRKRCQGHSRARNQRQRPRRRARSRSREVQPARARAELSNAAVRPWPR